MDKRLNLTKRAIEKLPTPRPGKRVGYHDTRVPGLGVVVQDTGNRMFFWFRKVRGRRTWRTLGEFPAMTVENARDKAQEINASLARWKSSDHQGPSPFERRGEPTITSVVEDYIAKRLRKHAKNPERAEIGVRWTVNKYLAPLLNRRLGSISRDDVRNLHADIGERNGEVTANRVTTLLRTFYNWAIKTELWRGDNPAARLEKFAEKSRERFMQPDELARLFTALRDEPNRDLQHFVILALFTGARRGDILSMRWADIAFDAAIWTVPEPKARRPYLVPLMLEVIDILEARRNASPWVFPSRGKSGHLGSLKAGWKQLMVRAKITGLNVHDLRRTLGSWQAAAGVSLPIIGASLGHRSTAATQVYARLQLDPVRQAVTAATRAMLAAKPT